MNEAFSLWLKPIDLILLQRQERPFWNELAHKALGVSQEQPLLVQLIDDLLKEAILGRPFLDLRRWLHELIENSSIAEGVIGGCFDSIWNGFRDWLVAHMPAKALTLQGDQLYILSQWYLERRLAQALSFYILQNDHAIDEASASEEFAVRLEGLLKGLNELQRASVEASLKFSLCCVAGGPGTGKTFTAARIVQALGWRRILSEKRAIRIALLAPTGKASVRLNESMQNALAESAENREYFQCEAMTLHRFFAIGAKAGGYHAKWNPAAYDIILVDEASMVDLIGFEKLLSSVHPRTHLILMGDPDQLPPIESPSLFSATIDLVQKAKSPFLTKLCSFLSQSLRAKNRSLVDASTAIRQGDYCNWSQHSLASESIQVHELKNWQSFLQNIENPTPETFYSIDHSLKKLGESIILCDSHQGLWGTSHLNSRLYEKLRGSLLSQNLFQSGEYGDLEEGNRKIFLDIPVMATVNQPDIERVNGEMGLIRLDYHQIVKWKTLEQALHLAPVIHFNNRGKRPLAIATVRLEKLEAAWAMTVHKSQGSEFNRVYFLLTPDAIRHGRSLLYTGFTRAKEQIEIWSEEITIKAFFETSCPDQLLSFQEELLTLLDKKGH